MRAAGRRSRCTRYARRTRRRTERRSSSYTAVGTSAALEQQIQVRTIHFRDVHVVVDVLLGVLVDELAPVLVIRVIHAEHTEADVRHLLGSAVECQLRILRFNLGLDFLAGTADAFLADFREGRVLACCLFRQLNKDEFTLSLIIGIFLDDASPMVAEPEKKSRTREFLSEAMSSMRFIKRVGLGVSKGAESLKSVLSCFFASSVWPTSE